MEIYRLIELSTGWMWMWVSMSRPTNTNLALRVEGVDVVLDAVHAPGEGGPRLRALQLVGQRVEALVQRRLL